MGSPQLMHQFFHQHSCYSTRLLSMQNKMTVFCIREIFSKKKNMTIIHFPAKHTQGNLSLGPVRVQIY